MSAEHGGSANAIPAANLATGETTEPVNPILQLLQDGMGDHHGFYWADVKVMSLPYIFYDADNGFSFYADEHSVQSGGVYAFEGHHIVRKDNHHHPALDLSITNFVFFQWLALIIAAGLFVRTGLRAKSSRGQAPKGLHNLLEVLVIFIRDEVVRPNMPIKAANRLTPYFLALFFFILTLNILGLLPGGHSAASSIATTAALALTAFVVVNYTAVRESGIGAWFHHLLGGAPAFLAPIMVPIEIMGLFTKPFALSIRLFANMTAGHVVLLSMIGLIFFFKQMFGASVGYISAVPSVFFSIFVYCLETLFIFLQAYIFTMLTAVFTGLAIGDHSSEESHAH